MKIQSKDKFIYAALFLTGLSVLFSIFGGGFAVFGGILGLIGVVLAVLLWKFGYMIMPAISKLTNQSYGVQVDYELPPSQDVIVKRGQNGLYYAASFLAIYIYDSSLEKTEEEIITYNRAFERLLANLKFPVKLAMLLAPEDISEHRRNLLTRKNLLQIQLNNERQKPDPDPTLIDKFEQEIKDIDRQLERLARGNRPIQLMFYAVVGGVGVSKDAAIAQSKQRALEFKSAVESTLNVETGFLVANHLLKAVELEVMMPSTVEEFTGAEP